jgi:hypothetical protein
VAAGASLCSTGLSLHTGLEAGHGLLWCGLEIAHLPSQDITVVLLEQGKWSGCLTNTPGPRHSLLSPHYVT